ncbi:uncharacterized protein LOC126565497 [Anopheles maculipalpis]|uniref:uncharacterized protein LOC126565497 n=1 Tax=Anopheles maculipalpis TaxID=1496333 RepID=UPI002159533F|nr:uncharacterized protein LOC126565497 [Anopheles maculipalpis]
MRFAVGFLVLAVLAISCQGIESDREDIAGSKDSALATFLQPLEAKWRDDQTIPERRSRELSYFGTGYSYNPYGGHHNPLYTTPYSQQGLYNPYASPGYGFGALNGYGGAGGLGGFGVGGSVGYLGTGAGGYPGGAQFGYSGFGQGAGAYPYGGGFNVGQSPYGGYGNQLGGLYNRGLYV